MAEEDPTVALSTHTFAQMTVDIITGYVARNVVPEANLPGLIGQTHAAVLTMYGLGAAPAASAPEITKPTPAEIRKSIRPDGLISFIDGKPYKTLKRHLTSHAHTPESYRTTYGLPADYPLTAAAYSAQRSALAKATGLGVVGGRAKTAAGALAA